MVSKYWKMFSSENINNIISNKYAFLLHQVVKIERFNTLFWMDLIISLAYKIM